MKPLMTDSVVEDAALEWFEWLGYAIINGPGTLPGWSGDGL